MGCAIISVNVILIAGAPVVFRSLFHGWLGVRMDLKKSMALWLRASMLDTQRPYILVIVKSVKCNTITSEDVLKIVGRTTLLA